MEKEETSIIIPVVDADDFALSEEKYRKVREMKRRHEKHLNHVRLAEQLHSDLVKDVENMLGDVVFKDVKIPVEEAITWCPTYGKRGISEDAATTDVNMAVVYVITRLKYQHISVTRLKRTSEPEEEKYFIGDKEHTRMLPGAYSDLVMSDSGMMCDIEELPSPILLSLLFWCRDYWNHARAI